MSKLLASIPTPQTNKNQQVVSIPLYYYKIQFDATLSTSAVWLQYVAGIPAPQTIRTHKFPIMAKNRLWLCNNMDNERNTVIFCAENAPDVWNGVDTGKIYFGDDKELTAGCSLYSRFGSNIYHVTLFFKRHSMYGLSGFSPEDFKQYNISESVGCVAPLTLKSIILGIENGQRPIAIWQGANGIYIFDNTTPICISNDISDIFDKNSSTKINPDMIEKSTAFIDYENMEYLFCYAEGSSTTLNKEKVLDLKKLQWFDIDRGTGKYLQCGIEVSDIKGNTYVYGGLDAGYLERLENGTDFDGNDIEHDLWTGDIAPFEGSIMYLTQVLRHKLVMVAKNLTGDTVAITHYGDGNIVGTSLTNVSMANASGRLADKLENWTSDPHIFHSFRYTVTTSNENKGFEPIFIGCKFNIIGEDLE
ncbi:hypothetical protein FJZ33_11960 [Candidatus Poribacteria bacterium]|nr:hypothetical protein [Candidatus Poribacteria bacterium]